MFINRVPLRFVPKSTRKSASDGAVQASDVCAAAAQPRWENICGAASKTCFDNVA